MTKSEMGYTDYGHIGPLLLFLNQYFNNFLPEVYVLYIALLWCTYDLLVYCSQVSVSKCCVLVQHIYMHSKYLLIIGISSAMLFNRCVWKFATIWRLNCSESLTHRVQFKLCQPLHRSYRLTVAAMLVADTIWAMIKMVQRITPDCWTMNKLKSVKLGPVNDMLFHIKLESTDYTYKHVLHCASK